METRVIEVPNRVLIAEVRRVLQEGRSATFRVRGRSMRLFLADNRDLVRVERRAPEEVRTGDVALAETAPEHYVLHRVTARHGNRLTLMGDGNIAGTESCLDTDVVGVVTAFYRKGRAVPDLATGLKWRAYSWLWLRLKPLRRVILGVCRRLPFDI